MFTSIYIAAFLMDFINSSVSIALSLFLAEIRGSSALIIGLAGFAAGFSYTATTFLKARFFPEKSIWFIYMPIGAGLVYFLLFFVPVPLVLMLLLIAGALYGIFWPSIQYCFSGEAEQKKIGIFNLCWSGGIICGSFLAGHIYALSYKTPFILAFVLGFAAMAALWLQRKKLIFLNNLTAQEKVKIKAPFSTIVEIRLLSFFHLTVVGAIMFLFPKLGLERFFSPQSIGIMFGILLLCRFLTFIVLKKKSILLHRHSFSISCFLFAAGCSLVGLSPHQPLIVAGMIIIGITGAFSYHNSLILHIKHNLPTEIHEGIIGTGLFLGPLLAGFFGHIFTIPAAFLIISILILAAGIIKDIMKTMHLK